MEETSALSQNIKDLENIPKIYKSLEIKLNEKVENLKGIDRNIQEIENNLTKETDLQSSDQLSIESFRVKALALEFEIKQKTHNVDSLIKDANIIEESQEKIEFKLKKSIKSHEEKSNSLVNYQQRIDEYNSKIERMRNDLIESDPELENMKSIIKLLKEKKNSIEKNFPEQVRNKTQRELENDVELLKVKSSLIQSNIDDLNDEIKKCRLEVEESLKLKNDLLLHQNQKNNAIEHKKADLRKQIKAKEGLLQKREDLTKKINLLIEKLNS